MWQLARAMTSQRHTEQQNSLLTINEIAASLSLFFYSVSATSYVIFIYFVRVLLRVSL